MRESEGKPATDLDTAGRGYESSDDLNEQIGLLLWMLEGELSPEERREVYQRLKELLSRKYGGVYV